MSDQSPSFMKRRHETFETHEEIISYQKLRTFIGFTGILLPILLVLGCYITGAANASFQISVSHYYYSKMHLVFVGALSVLGGFLISYRGKHPSESRLSNFAGLFSFAIAAFPTTRNEFLLNDKGNNLYLQLYKDVTHAWGDIHLVFAAALFICFIIFCFNYFQMPDRAYSGEELKKFASRRKIYKTCGWVIIGSIAMIAVFSFLIDPKKGFFMYSTFIFETTSLWAFGFAWLVKGSEVWVNVPGARKLVRAIR